MSVKRGSAMADPVFRKLMTETLFLYALGATFIIGGVILFRALSDPYFLIAWILIWLGVMIAMRSERHFYKGMHEHFSRKRDAIIEDLIQEVNILKNKGHPPTQGVKEYDPEEGL